MKITQKAEQEALYWYVRISSPEFSQEQEAEFYAWLNASSMHQVALVRIDQAWSAGKVVQELPQRETYTTNHLKYWAMAATAVLICALSVYLVRLPANEVILVEHYSTPPNQQKIIDLADGSTLVLHSNSNASLHYSNHSRELKLLNGQIFLRVAPDPGRPFMVLTETGTIRVIGTQFAVQQLPGDIKITVLEGLVGLLKPEYPTSSPLIVLGKNQQIRYSDALKGIEAAHVEADRETSWISGRIIFEGTALIDAVATINQHLHIPIKIASPELEQKRIVGAISILDPLLAAHSLANITGAMVDEQQTPHTLMLKLGSY